MIRSKIPRLEGPFSWPRIRQTTCTDLTLEVTPFCVGLASPLSRPTNTCTDCAVAVELVNGGLCAARAAH